MDLLLLLVLILFNGLFAMSEIALISSRAARLQRLADEGHHGARTALELHSEPSSFLSAIQVGITSVGVLSGAIGESAIADPLGHWLLSFPLLADHARPIALTVTVILITYFSVVLGELVPKRLGLLAPEYIAGIVARPMAAIARGARPLVWLLSSSSDAVLRLLRARRSDEPPVTDAEIEALMEQGAEAGIFHESEQELVSNVLRLDEQAISSIMTPRVDLYALDLEDEREEQIRRIVDSPYHRIVVCRGGLVDVVGVLHTHDMLKHLLAGEQPDIEASLQPAHYVPESRTTTELLQFFRESRAHCALVVNEWGQVEGLVTPTDVLGSIVGDFPDSESEEDPDIVQRDDGSWLVDGATAIERFKDELEIGEELPGEAEESFHSVGGFVMHQLGRVPKTADHFESMALRFEVMDMDRHRVDKVLVTRLHLPTDEEETG
ncbi:hemolysin family protein [Niveibacterium sp. SC-1]|uniref:hemolysin family protein n=1 Tax=Niveibacterium sp. SC-1 TaxID=3135646 RepID=UPI00311DAF39